MSNTFWTDLALETKLSGSDPNPPAQRAQRRRWCQNQNQSPPQVLFAVLCDCVCLLSQVDVTKCVVNTDPSFRSHWLVSAVCTFGHYLKSVVLHLLREKWCSSSSSSESLLWMMFTLVCTEPLWTNPLPPSYSQETTQVLPPSSSSWIFYLFIFLCYCFGSSHLFDKEYQPHLCWALLNCPPYSPRAVTAVFWQIENSSQQGLCRGSWGTRKNLHFIHELQNLFFFFLNVRDCAKLMSRKHTCILL